MLIALIVAVVVALSVYYLFRPTPEDTPLTRLEEQYGYDPETDVTTQTLHSEFEPRQVKLWPPPNTNPPISSSQVPQGSKGTVS